MTHKKRQYTFYVYRKGNIYILVLTISLIDTKKRCNNMKTNQFYPKVLRHKNGKIVLVYKDRVETYNHDQTETKTQIDKQNGFDAAYQFEEFFKEKGWNPLHEIEIMKTGAGYKEVHSIREENNEESD